MTDKSVWNPIRTVPRDTPVKLKTVHGIICTGRVPKGEKMRRRQLGSEADQCLSPGQESEDR